MLFTLYLFELRVTSKIIVG